MQDRVSGWINRLIIGYAGLVKCSQISLTTSLGFFLIILILVGCRLENPSDPPVFPHSPAPPGSVTRPPESGSQPDPSPAPATSCSQSGVIFCDPGTHLGSFTITIPQFRGSSGFLQYNISGIFLEGDAKDYGVAFLSNTSDFGFEGQNWIYVKGLDSGHGNPIGAWKIKATAQGTVYEVPFISGRPNNFNPGQTYLVRVEWSNLNIRALIDGQVVTSVNLGTGVIFNSLSLSINTSPRANLEPGYPGAIISNVIVGQ